MMTEGKAPSPRTIERCVAAFQRARDALASDGQLASDEVVLAAALDADPYVVPPDDLLRRMVRAIVWSESRAAEAQVMAKAIQARQQRYEARAMVLRRELLDIMIALERSSFAGSPFATVSVRKGTPSPVVLDEAVVPDQYFTTVRKLDRRALFADLKQGVVIEGAVLSNAVPTLALIRPHVAGDVEQVEEVE